jgi:hypothetical protein
MVKAFRVTVACAAMAPGLSLTAPAQAGNGSAVGAGLAGFGIGAILGGALAPREVYVVPPPPLRRSITDRWPTDRRHGRQAGVTTAHGVIQASTPKRDISWVRTGRPISAARA